jgi:hypothetical protein
MKHAILAVLILFSTNVHAAKLVSAKGLQYLPVFGVGSTGSVAYNGTANAGFKWFATGGGQTTLLRIMTTSAAYIAQGAAPTATALDLYLPANTELILEVPSGNKISAIQASGPGRVFATELITYPSAD